ncbi:acyltransferase [Arthrobacter sp. IA7]|uniref:acyltransferase family protein n=1 Tax=Arthrobacter ipis TaxID=2716202 RepID=UPI001683C181|nr:acyltransferase family protein [Arthrobacter ipis]MBD1540739.1 acyltransferase [Arthrobacter ipis]
MSRGPTTGTAGQRADIQGLRTLSVGIVIAYHLRPDLLPGGFVGVDVFFVISGFLIVGSLVREISEHGRIGMLAFYARRIRRLLPASTAVLLATMVGAVLLMPQHRWQSIALDVVMSAIQIQNWNQAFSSVSYESANALVSPVQHFWSLAVEEQFYIIIPLLLVGAGLVARRSRIPVRRCCAYLLGLMVCASLIHSVLFTASNHDVAYFATTTRMWEIGLGGLGALLLPVFRPGVRTGAVLAWLGLAMILSAAILYSTQMEFPGLVALLPVTGAALVLMSAPAPAGSPRQGEVSVLHPATYLSVAPMKYLGDISYSLYLWHWPLIVFYVYLAGRTPNLATAALLAGASVLLAVLSYRFVEQPFRQAKRVRPAEGRRFRARPRTLRDYALGVSLIATTCLTAAAPWGVVEAKSASLNYEISDADYPGALAFDPGRPAHVPQQKAVVPDPAVATKDVPLTNKDGCNVYDPVKSPDTGCTYGDLEAQRTLAIIGDSHASQYVDPLASIGEKNGWKVRAMVRNGCPFTAAPPASKDTVFSNCPEQNRQSLRKLLRMKPDMVVVAGMTPAGYKSALGWEWKNDRELVSGYQEMLRPLIEAGIKVSVISDSPFPAFSVPDCVERNGPAAPNCSVPDEPDRAQTDPLRVAAQEVGGLGVVDLGNYFCRNGSCPPVIGNVLVYRDNHLTATFARTLSGPLKRALKL